MNIKMMHYIRLAISLCAMLLLGCSPSQQGSELGREFYRGSILTKSERLKAYSISDQWEIYYYGTTTIHPPDLELSEYLARNGEPMAVYIFNFLDFSRADVYFINSLNVLSDMALYKYYDYCQNTSNIAKLNANQSLIKNSSWRDYYGEKRTRMPC